jgi:hypothetical protein
MQKKDWQTGRCLEWYWGWMAGLHGHHDHGGDLDGYGARFPETLICDQCNAADGRIKRTLRLPKDFSFSPDELRLFIKSVPHGSHTVDLEAAKNIALEHGLLFV